MIANCLIVPCFIKILAACMHAFWVFQLNVSLGYSFWEEKNVIYLRHWFRKLSSQFWISVSFHFKRRRHRKHSSLNRANRDSTAGARNAKNEVINPLVGRKMAIWDICRKNQLGIFREDAVWLSKISVLKARFWYFRLLRNKKTRKHFFSECWNEIMSIITLEEKIKPSLLEEIELQTQG